METDVDSAELDFFIRDADKLPLYLRLRGVLTSLAPGCEVRVHKTTISFRAPRPFVYVGFSFRKHYPGVPDAHLMASFMSPQPCEHPLAIQSTLIRPGLYTIHALILPPGDLEDGLLSLIKQSLMIRNK